ncbi:MAG: hypothetical protein WBB85_12550 [Albidovulum sp.]|uniref:hypothetical protein n=1 Tax=Albidovulum sp. TaxID=1872424 RepID=UPI003C88E17E
MKSFVLAFVTFFWMLGSAFAATILEPSNSVVVVETVGEIANVTASKGTAVVNMDEDGVTRLIFIAPNDIPQELVELSYQLDGEDQNTTFRIIDGASVFGSNQTYDASLKALFILFVLAIVVESGLQLLFRWRPYLRTFNTSGTNALIAFAFSWFFVAFFELDIASRLVNAYLGISNGFDNSTVGYILTAMIIAGGSAGVNRVFRAFGIRPLGPPAEVAGPKDDTTAWISVTIARNEAVGPITVLYGEPGQEAVVGTVNGTSDRGWFSSLFLRNKGRFPESGGYSVNATTDQRAIRVFAQDKEGKPIPVLVWGPFAIGPRAIIDVVRKV